ncbi:GPS1 [Auxenochlorella protothecoides x Auxenochlorella symbiontica]
MACAQAQARRVSQACFRHAWSWTADAGRSACSSHAGMPPAAAQLTCWRGLAASAPAVDCPATSPAAASPAAAPPAAASPAASPPPDPFALVREELGVVSERMRRSIVTDIPALGSAADYFFRLGADGKRLRSTVLLLLATRLAPAPPDLARLEVDESPARAPPGEPRRRQQRLAEITELIHIASLLHDDVIDEAGTRRGVSAANAVFGNKVAILAGDFLLARASVSLASLRDTRVIELMSACLESLVAGEILQLTADPEQALCLDHYLRKTYCKTASLMANSARSVALLGPEPGPDAAQAAWDYGRALGLAFQLVDDVLDFTASADELGKPALNDLRSGLATAPVLYAAQASEPLRALARRRFAAPGDVDAALAIVAAGDGLARARRLAADHADLAVQALGRLPPPACEEAGAAHAALLELTARVLSRRS